MYYSLNASKNTQYNSAINAGADNEVKEESATQKLFSPKTSLNLTKPTRSINIPPGVAYSNKPLTAKNAVIEELSPRLLAEKLGFEYTEMVNDNKSIANELNVYSKEDKNDCSIRSLPTNEDILSRLKKPLNVFVVCDISIAKNALFTRADIPAGSVLFVCDRLEHSIARFMQNLPIDLEEKEKEFIKCYLENNNCATDELLAEELYETRSLKDSFNKINGLIDDFEGVSFDDHTIRKSIAKANVEIFTRTINGNSLIIFWAPKQIKANQQLGFSYINYYRQNSYQNILYFNQESEIILPFNYHLSDKLSKFSTVNPIELYKSAIEKFQSKKYNDAALDLLQAINNFKDKNRNTIKVATCYSTLASCFRDIGDFKMAYRACSEATRIYEACNTDLTPKLKAKYNDLLTKAKTCIIDSTIDKFKPYYSRKINSLEVRNRHIIRGCPLYFTHASKGGDWEINNNNVKAEDEGFSTVITCRHFAFAQLSYNKDYHTMFSSLSNIRAIKSLKENEFDSKRILFKADAYMLVNLARLGESLQTICKYMKIGENKQLLFFSINHAMSITIKYKDSSKDNPERYIIKFFDPNRTTVHVRAICANLEAVSNLKIIDFISSKRKIELYFPKAPYGILSLYNSTQVESLSDEYPSKKCDFHVNHDNYSSYYHAFLYFAMQCNFSNLNHIIIDILNSGCSDDKKITLLEAKFPNNPSGLSVALALGHKDTVSLYVNSILQSNLSDNKKSTLLEVKLPTTNNVELPGLCYALAYGHKDAVSSYVNSILQSNLSDNQKISLLKFKFRGILELHFKFMNGCKDAAEAYVNSILKSKLSESNKKGLIDQKFLYSCSSEEIKGSSSFLSEL